MNGGADHHVLVHNPKHFDWKAIEDIKDSYVQDMGRFAVAKFTNELIEEIGTFIRVVSCGSVVVEEGTMYRIVVEMKKENVTQSNLSSIELYVAKVLDHKYPLKSWTLWSFECSTLLALPYGLAL